METNAAPRVLKPLLHRGQPKLEHLRGCRLLAKFRLLLAPLVPVLAKLSKSLVGVQRPWSQLCKAASGYISWVNGLC